MLSDATTAAIRLANALDAVGFEYLLGGSLASIIHGIPRMTQDADFVVDVNREGAPALVAALDTLFFVDGEMVKDAIAHGGSFNVLDRETFAKVDVYIRRAEPFSHSEWHRRVRVALDADDPDAGFWVASAEDIILQKIRWYREGGGVSDRQWLDVLGVMKVQAQALDFGYLQQWASQLELTDLLERALDEAGLKE